MELVLEKTLKDLIFKIEPLKELDLLALK